jgi:ATP-dependent RNA helicase DDX24/MAK5
MSAWTDLYLPKSLLKGLYTQGFLEPTPIQRMVVPAAIKERKNIIGAAQTGSGKTLAFGLPILSRLCDSSDQEQTNNHNDGPQALILTPTRELAIQIKQHLQMCAKYHKTKVVVVVGGISQLKQERLLKKNPEIIVATPGRLMQMIDEVRSFLLITKQEKPFEYSSKKKIEK